MIRLASFFRPMTVSVPRATNTTKTTNRKPQNTLRMIKNNWMSVKAMYVSQSTARIAVTVATFNPFKIFQITAQL